LGTAPVIWDMTLPFLTNSRVGILRTKNLEEVLGLSFTFILSTFTCPLWSLAIFFRDGSSARQGAHVGEEKSTMTALLLSFNKASKFESFADINSFIIIS
jgi:hypothetical protein